MTTVNREQNASITLQARNIGTLIRSARKQQHLTQAQLAKHIQITIPTLRRLEAGDTSISLHTFLAGLSALNLEHDVLHCPKERSYYPLLKIKPGEKQTFAKRLESNAVNSRDAENAAWILSLSGQQRIGLLQKQEKEQKLCGIALQ